MPDVTQDEIQRRFLEIYRPSAPAGESLTPQPPVAPRGSAERSAEARILDLAPYRRAGLRLIPLRRWDDKGPHGKEVGKAPRDPLWRRRNYPNDEIDQATRDGWNVGYRMSEREAVIDYDPRNDPDGSGRAALLASLPPGFLESCPHVITGSGGDHWYVKLERRENLLANVAGMPGVELKGFGRQVVAAGSRHPNGSYYDWDDFAPEASDAPLLPSDSPLLAAARRPEGADNSTVTGGELTPEQLERLLAQLDPCNFREHDVWLSVGMASYHATGGAGLDAFVEWSTRDEQYAGHETQIRERWSSFNRTEGPVSTIRTLFKYVEDAGGTLAGIYSDSFPDELPVVTEAPGDDVHRQGGLVRLSDVTPLDVEWLWWGRVPLEMLTINTGDPETAKTATTMDALARVTRGDPMPGSIHTSAPANVLVLSCEDSIRHVVVPRMMAAGADLSRTFVLDEAWDVRDLAKLDRLLSELKPRVVFVDALMASFSGVDTYVDAQVRGPLEALVHLVARHSATLWATRHTRKARGPIAVHAGMASIAFSAIARSELFYSANPDDPTREFVVAHAKCNVGRKAPSLRYRLIDVRLPGLAGTWPKVEWLGESRYSANDLAGWSPNDPGDARGPDRRTCTDWLREWWGDRSDAPVEEIKAAAESEGLIFEGHVWKRARRDLGLVPRGRGRNSSWVKVG